MHSRNLATRDKATAALLGLIGATTAISLASGMGADFGVDFGDDNGNDDESYGSDFGVDFGSDYGVDFGAEAAAAAVQATSQPSTQQMLAVWKNHMSKQQRSQGRARLLEPNSGSDVKIERYGFSVNASLTLGTAAAITASGNPDTNIRPQRVTMNSPAPGFATVSEIKVANVSVTVGGIGDMYEYNANGVGQSLDMPTLTPAQRATILGSYSGFVPPGFVAASPYLFCGSFKGPATITA